MKNRGFTLVEYILVIALSGIIFVSLAQAVIITIRSFDIALAGTEIIGKYDTAYARMMREIRHVKNVSSLVTANSNEIRFIDVDNNDIDYRMSGNQLLRNSTAAIDGVTALTFEYYDRNSAAIATPIVSPSSTNVRMVAVTITVAASNQSVTVQSLTKLRNVR